ncbi:extradiol dioxygenase [Pedobacter sp. LMG 31464]|uniref:Extradiol dioxygenase n=1 Tax=Pedobacter planticolens TaxID=2679964 RepID=A0A923E415_9SPHI|nr:VOC family protein [Pedobacter planticolens]MBB2147114.1 extradiol dioxygenase [Pedobacter planticolens]
MTKDIWINLPVKNINKSVAFFTQMGFTLNEHNPVTETMASFFIGDRKLVLMLFTNDVLAGFSGNKVADTSVGTEVLFSIDAESSQEVDQMLQKAENAGGKIYANGGEKDGWMYGGGFIDVDGHRWNVLYMDFSKMSK